MGLIEKILPASASDVRVDVRGVDALPGVLVAPDDALGTVIFAHDSGSTRLNPRDNAIAKALNECGFATLLFDLLTLKEHGLHYLTCGPQFDIELQSERLVGAIDWLAVRRELARLPVGIFGASTGAGVALCAAAARPERVAAVVCRGGRPELAGEALAHVAAPTLFIVGSKDVPVLAMNRQSAARLRCEHRVDIVPGATHLFEEAGMLDRVARLAGEWFLRHFGARRYDFSH